MKLCDSITRVTLDVLLQCACSYKSGCQKDELVIEQYNNLLILFT